jgi:hypothetical protein
MANADQTPASGRTATSGRPYSGTSESSDPTNQPGQFPPGNWGTALFGGPLSGSGAPGSQGASGPSDPTIMAGQNSDGLTGITDAQITQSGAPGGQGAVNGGSGGSSITFTQASDGIGPYAQITDNDDLSGPKDSTQANDAGYASGGPQLPGIKGNEPEAGSSRYQPGGGHVMRGGRDIRP